MPWLPTKDAGLSCTIGHVLAVSSSLSPSNGLETDSVDGLDAANCLKPCNAGGNRAKLEDSEAARLMEPICG